MMTESIENFKSAAGKKEFLAAYQASLSLWTAPYEELYIPTRNGTVHVIASGPAGAPTLVLLHGAGTSATLWYPNMAGLAQKLRVYAIDNLGDAGKSEITQPFKSPAEAAAWLLDVLDGLGLKKTTVGGLSQGGWYALNLALHAPERISRLVLLAPAASFLPFSLRFYLIFFGLGVILPSPNNTRRIFNHISAHAEQIHPYIVRQLYLTRHVHIQTMFPTVFSDAQLNSIRLPTLLLIGEKEMIYNPRKALARAEKCMPDVQTELIPDANHTLNVDQPELVNEKILKFLA